MSILLKGGQILDGTGQPSFHSDVLITNNKIQHVSLSKNLTADKIIDCRGKIIAPGFIDVHSHMDYFAVGDSHAHFDSFVAQGITSMVVGNCGFSPFGFRCSHSHHALIENSLFQEGHDTIHWHDFNGYKEKLVNQGIVPNIVSLAGHGTCRTSLNGFNPSPLTKEQHREMLSLLEASLEKGAAGISLGLQYKPGVFAGMDELKDVAKLAQKHHKILSVHAKAYSFLSGTYPLFPLGQPHNLRAIDDMLNLARETGVRLQFSHLLFAGEKTWQTVDQALAKFDQAIADGVDVKFDLFPYPFGAGLLNSIFPEWAMAGMPGILKKFVPMLRLRLELYLGNKLVGMGYDALQLTNAGCEAYAKYNGRFLSDIAHSLNTSAFNVLIDIMFQSDAEARIIFHKFYDQETIDKLIQHPAAMYMTDAWPEPSGIENSACYGAFPRFLELARTKKLLTPEEIISRMTKQAAERFGIENRGVIKEDGFADIVVLDWDNVSDNCSANQTNARPSGIKHVFINGNQVIENGEKGSNEAFGDFVEMPSMVVAS